MNFSFLRSSELQAASKKGTIESNLFRRDGPQTRPMPHHHHEFALLIRIDLINFYNITGQLTREGEDSSHYISASAASLASMRKSAVYFDEDMLNSAPPERMLLPKLESKPLIATPQHDIVTPIPTVPAINPSNPTVSTTPTYNSIPTESNPVTPMITPSTMNPINPYTTPSTGMPTASSGLSWCIASQSASQTSLQVALDYACGYGGADCSQIQPGGSCFDPDTVRNHATYAVNNYYLKNPIPSSCDFGGIYFKFPLLLVSFPCFNLKPPPSPKLIHKINYSIQHQK